VRLSSDAREGTGLEEPKKIKDLPMTTPKNVSSVSWKGDTKKVEEE